MNQQTPIAPTTAIFLTAALSAFVIICANANGRVNLARGKPASHTDTTWGGWPNYAVDGGKDTNFFSWSCTHTNEYPITWWMVDLQQIHTIGGVEITTRQHHWDRLANFSVEISVQDPTGLAGFPGSTSSPVCLTQTSAIPSSATFYYRCTTPIRGRYLRLVKYRSHNSALSLCEFEAYEPYDAELERADNPNGVPDILWTVPGTPIITECARLCFYHSGYPCKHIQVHRANKTCRLLKSFQTSNGHLNPDWDLFTVTE